MGLSPKGMVVVVCLMVLMTYAGMTSASPEPRLLSGEFQCGVVWCGVVCVVCVCGVWCVVCVCVCVCVCARARVRACSWLMVGGKTVRVLRKKSATVQQLHHAVVKPK